MTDPQTDVSRRGFLRAATGATTAAAATGAAAAQTESPAGETATPGGANATAGSGNGIAGDGNATGGGQAGTAAGGETHTVEMTDDLVFDPEEITIAPGDTIEWVNVGQIGHSVTAYADEIPEEADYFASGGFDSMQAAVNNYTAGDPDAGFIPADGTYSHTFETPGDYEYFCIPHESAGMVGTVTVSEGGGQAVGGGGAGGGAVAPDVPDVARNFALLLTAGLLGVLSFTYLLIRYGGDYSWEA